MERVKQGLSEAGLLPEEWGGQTPMVAVRFSLLHKNALCQYRAAASNSRTETKLVMSRHKRPGTHVWLAPFILLESSMFEEDQFHPSSVLVNIKEHTSRFLHAVLSFSQG